MDEDTRFNGMTMDEVTWKCAAFMHQHLEAPKGFKDFDIIQKFMDDKEWAIHLRPNYAPHYIMSFFHKRGTGYIEVSTFEARSKFNAIF